MATTQSTEQQELNELIELGQALSRLENNSDFKRVIKDGYIMRTLVEESQYMLSVEPHTRQEALEKVQSVNYLRHYFTSIKNDTEAAIEASNEE